VLHAGAAGHAGSLNMLKGMLWGGNNDFLHNHPLTEVYTLLIDSWRMRVEDEYTYQAKNQGVYAFEDPVPGFRDSLEKAERKQGVLPS